MRFHSLTIGCSRPFFDGGPLNRVVRGRKRAMDIEAPKLHDGDPDNNAYSEIRKVLLKQGFARQQGSVYFGGEGSNAVTCVLAAIELARTLVRRVGA
jgi:hypothetical protein